MKNIAFNASCNQMISHIILYMALEGISTGQTLQKW